MISNIFLLYYDLYNILMFWKRKVKFEEYIAYSPKN